MFGTTILNTMTLGTVAASAAMIPARAASSEGDFTLRAVVTNYELSPPVTNHAVALRHVGPCESNLVLVPGNATTGFNFGDASDTVSAPGFPSPGGMVVNPGGTATVPSANVVKMECDGVDASSPFNYDGGYLTYDGGFWMACPADIAGAEDSGDVVLSYKQNGQRTLAGCADVVLVMNINRN